MFRSGFFRKIYAGYVVMILMTTIMVGGIIGNQMEKDLLDETRESLKSHAAVLMEFSKPSLIVADGASIQKHVEALREKTKIRLTVIGGEGTVLADSEEDPQVMDNHFDRPEIDLARTAGEGESIRHSNTLNTRMMYLALPMEKDGKRLGYVRTAVSLTSIDKRNATINKIIFLGTGVAIILALGIGLFIAGQFVKPIASMTEIAESMADGDYDRRLHSERRDEIGKLASTFNRMAESLKERVETISSENSKLQAIMAGMVEGVVALDGDQRISHMNLAAGKILNTDLEKSLGKYLWEVSSLGELREMVDKSFREKRVIKTKFHLAKHFKNKVIEMQSAPTFYGDKEIAGAVIVLYDISELHNLENLRRDFVANVSHELKTPLTAIRGLLETVIDNDDMPVVDQKRFMVNAREQSLRLASLVTDILTLAKLESDTASPEKTILDLNDIVSATLELFADSADAKNIKIVCMLDEVPVKINGNENSLSSAVGNLIDNAIKYTPDGGSINLRVSRTNGNARFEVKDSGLGIDPLHQERIFERFYRVDKARSRELGGTGLGLSIVKHIAITHGGGVSLYSTPDKGSIFTITLPLT